MSDVVGTARSARAEAEAWMLERGWTKEQHGDSIGPLVFWEDPKTGG